MGIISSAFYLLHFMTIYIYIYLIISELQKDVDELDNSGINNTTLGGNKSSVGVTGDISLSEADISQQLKQAQQVRQPWDLNQSLG